MEQQKSMFSELMSRRIPQILGMYVASVWLCVEIADWMGERFPVPATFSSHVFIFLLALLPAVTLLAWGHGKPGKDQWTKFQVSVILMNVFLAFWAAQQFVSKGRLDSVIPPQVPLISEATLIDKKTVVDEKTGEPVFYEVAKSGKNQKVSLFFFDNNSGDESLNWLSGGASWLLSQDLKRSPVISVETPLDSNSMRLDLQNKGFKEALNEPVSLDLQIAKNKSAQWAIKGEVYKEHDELTFKASLYNVMTGALIKTVSHRHANWLTALDLISSELSAVIIKDQNAQVTIPGLTIEQHVSSDLKAIKLVVEGLHAMKFNNDYDSAKKALSESVVLDPNLAEAYVIQMRLYMNTGEFSEVQQAAKKALDLDYKLYDEDVFGVKAQLYAVTGDEDKALKVLENWVKVYPESSEALFSLGQNLIIKGHRLNDAENIFKRLSEIEQGSKHLLQLSNIYLLQENFSKAENALNVYLTYEPESVPALMALGKISQRQGDFETAAVHFESAMLAGNNEIEAAIHLAINLGVSRDPELAIINLNDLMNEAQNNQEIYAVYTAIEQMYLQKGQLTKALQNLDMSEPYSKAVLPPIGHMLNFQGKKMAYLSALGSVEEASVLLDQLEKDTKPPFNKLMVFTRLNFHGLQNDKEGIAQYLIQAKEVVKEFEMSVYQQFIFNYEAVLKRSNKEFEKAQQWHKKAIKEAQQSIIALTTQELVETFKYEQARTFINSNQYNQAIEILDGLLINKPRSAEYKYLKAQVLFKNGDVTEAKKVIEEIKALWIDADRGYTKYIEFKAFSDKVLGIQ